MKLGIDVGSTTVKLVLLNEQDEILYQKYERHMSSVFDKVRDLLIQMQQEMYRLSSQAPAAWRSPIKSARNLSRR